MIKVSSNIEKMFANFVYKLVYIAMVRHCSLTKIQFLDLSNDNLHDGDINSFSASGEEITVSEYRSQVNLSVLYLCSNVNYFVSYSSFVG